MSRSRRSIQQTWQLLVCDAPKELLDAKAKLVALTLSTYANANGGKVHPGEARLVDDTGLSLSSVRRAVRILRDLGLLDRVVEGSRHGRRGLADEYRLTFGRAYAEALGAAPETPVRMTGVRLKPKPEHRSEGPGTPVAQAPNTGHGDPPPDQHQTNTSPKSSDFGAVASASTRRRDPGAHYLCETCGQDETTCNGMRGDRGRSCCGRCTHAA
jgi:hypothetical protein